LLSSQNQLEFCLPGFFPPDHEVPGMLRAFGLRNRVLSAITLIAGNQYLTELAKND
jgi:hypothetical protein